MSNKTSSSSSSIGFLGLLAIVFIVLKLTDFIDWSWWWVLMPIWAPIPIVFLCIVTFGGLWLATAAIRDIWAAHRRRKRGW